MFGAPKVVRNLSKSLRRKEKGRWTYTKVIPEEIDLKQTLKVLKINYFQLVDLVILIGTDYNEGIENVGAKTALALVKKHGHLETILKEERNNYDFGSLPYESIQRVREVFIFPDVIEDLEVLQYNRPNRNQTLEFLCSEHFLNQERVEKALDLVTKRYKTAIAFTDKKGERKIASQTTLV